MHVVMLNGTMDHKIELKTTYLDDDPFILMILMILFLRSALQTEGQSLINNFR